MKVHFKDQMNRVHIWQICKEIMKNQDMSYSYLLFGLWGYWHCGHSWPIVPALGNSEDDCGEADGM
jgi:hypothetical protein